MPTSDAVSRSRIYPRVPVHVVNLAVSAAQREAVEEYGRQVTRGLQEMCEALRTLMEQWGRGFEASTGAAAAIERLTAASTHPRQQQRRQPTPWPPHVARRARGGLHP